MNTQIEDLTLIKILGKGSYGEVFLSTKRGKSELFATKKISRAQADQPSFKKYFENEIRILNSLRHPNVVKLEELKATKDYYFIVMEYINGGSLTDCLKKYQQRYGRAFPEEIVQYLMRQIVSAIKYIHDKKIIHRDLKLDNIMVKFNNDMDLNNLNMMNANIKIIDFGLAIQLTQSNLAFSALGSPQNMDPLILKKYNNMMNNKEIGYDYKADIWSLGTICYELLIGKAVFNAETMNDLITKVENGSYSVPTSVSSEVVSFLNGMLQYKGEKRLSADELSKHPFLIKRVNEFTKIDTQRAQRKIDNRGLNINVKKNQTIWSIFNPDSEKILVNIRGGRDYPASEGPISEYTPNKRSKTEKNIPRMPYNNQFNNNNINNNPIHKANTDYPGFGSNISFYGQNMNPNLIAQQQRQIQLQQQMQMQQQYQMQQRMGGMGQIPSSQPLPGMELAGMQRMPGMGYNNYNSLPTYGSPNYPIGGRMSPSNYPPGYGQSNFMSPYNPSNNIDDDDDPRNGLCSIQ